MKPISKQLVSVSIVLLFSSATASTATDWYVDYDCATNGDGTQDCCLGVGGCTNGAWNSITPAQKHSGNVSNGDTIHMKGTLSTTGQGITFNSSDSGVSGNVITYVVDSGEAFIIKHTTGCPNSRSGLWMGADHVTIDGWIVESFNHNLRTVTGVISTGVTVTNCIFRNSCLDNVSSGDGDLEHFRFQNNTVFNAGVYDGGTQMAHLIYISDCDYCTIKGNTLYSDANISPTGYLDGGNGIQLQSRWTVAGHKITNCIVEGNRIFGLLKSAGTGRNGHGSGIITNDYSNTPHYVTGNIVRNNLIYNVGGDCFSFQNEQNPANQYLNNTCYNPGDSGFGSGSLPDGYAVILNNIISNTNRAFQDYTDYGTVDQNLCDSTGNGCEFAESAANTFQFVDDTNPDFLKIRSTASAKENGLNLSGDVDDDYWGTSRPQGSGYDIGAHEYSSIDHVPPSAPQNLQIR